MGDDNSKHQFHFILAGICHKSFADDALTTEWPETISRRLAQEIADKVHLALPMGSILVDTYPDLPNDAPAVMQRWQATQVCRYCNQRFGTREHRLHLLQTRGTCQLEHTAQLHQYIVLLQSSLEDDLGKVILNEDPSYDDEEEEEETGLDELTRPIAEPAFTAWTVDETNRFFYALARFSRFRPDAIAEHVQTKNETEVNILLAKLEENAALFLGPEGPAKAKPALAAREMSRSWLKREEELAEGAVVWEAFIQQATRTPPEYRDVAQQDAVGKLWRISCVQCSTRRCDGHWPICSKCKEQDEQCSWPADCVTNMNPQ